MSDLLSISSLAVSAYQRALSTVSNNIANVSTDGYSRQDVALESNSPAKSASYYLGTGVMFGAVKRQFDAFAESNLRKSSSDLSSQGPMVDYTKRVMDIMGDKSVGLSSALDQFFDAARQLSVEPASTVQRGSFLRSAEGLASRFAELSGQLDLISEETRQALEGAAGQFNTLTNQLALVNQQLNKTPKLEEQPSELLDRRDLLLRQMSEFANVKTSFDTNGVVRASLGATVNQSLVVDKMVAKPIGVDTSNGKFDFVLDPYGTTEALSSIQSGSMGGLSTFLSTVLEPAHKALDYLAKTFVQEVNQAQTSGIDGYGRIGNNLFSLDPSKPHEASAINVMLTDPLKVATAALFRVSEGTANTSTVHASISYALKQSDQAISNPNLTNNPNPAAGVPVKVDSTLGFKALTNVAAGVDSPVFYLDHATEGQQLQILTADGRHLLGKPLTLDQQYQFFNTDNGFVSDATYSDQYLNLSGQDGYRDIQVVYGAKADVRYAQKLDSNGQPMAGDAIPAVLESGPVSSSLSGEIASDGDLKINGIPLGALNIDASVTDKAGAVAAWVNNANIPGLHAQAYNLVEFLPSKLDYKAPLTLNGFNIRNYGDFTDLSSLVQAIQASTADTQVTARLGEQGQLLIENLPARGGQSIDVGSTDPKITAVNAFGLQAQSLTGKIRLTRDLDPNHVETSGIAISFGEGGSPSQLAKLGIRTGAYIQGKVPDDLLVFVTGAGADATVAASYSGQPGSVQENLRAQSLSVKFVDKSHYVIIDEATQTELAKRSFNPEGQDLTIDYQGLRVYFNTLPRVGDAFTIDGNRDGVGDNTNMLAMVDLSKKGVIDGKTFSNAYIDQVNTIGNLAQQAKITQQALTVVNDQAIQARDKVSGVNLDDEAAELIRYQQAYQASAKAMQLSNELFSTIVQIR